MFESYKDGMSISAWVTSTNANLTETAQQGDAKQIAEMQNRAFSPELTFHALVEQGVKKFPDDSKYEGQLKNNQRSGFGTMSYRSGNEYSGYHSYATPYKQIVADTSIAGINVAGKTSKLDNMYITLP